MNMPRHREHIFAVTNILESRLLPFLFKAAGGMAVVAVVICLSLSSLSLAQTQTEATATINFIAMKSEAALLRLFHLMDQKDIEGAAEYLRENGVVITKGTNITILSFGCDGRCVRFRIKAQPREYWALAADAKE